MLAIMESRRGMLRALLVVAQLALFVSAQDCLMAAEMRQTPFTKLGGMASRLPRLTQAIITSYKFRCCGNITSWHTYVQPGSGMHQEKYDIYFQVWRPSPTLPETGCYSMVGMNVFTSISLNDGLVRESPEPSNILTVQPDDVVGYFTISRKGKNDGIQLDDSQSVDSVWYDIITISELINAEASNCPLPVGTEAGRSLARFTDAAPVLSVNVFSFACPPPTPTVTTSSSSSLPPSSSLLLPSKIATTTFVPSNIISQPLLSSTSLPSTGTFELTDAPSFHTDMFFPSTKPTSAIPVGIVAGVMVALILVLSLLVVLVVVLLLWRRKRLQNSAILEVAGNGVNLSNPNYDSSSLLATIKKTNSKKQRRSLVTPPYVPLYVTLDDPNMASAMYESLDTKEPADYMEPTSSHETVPGSYSKYACIPVPPRNAEARRSVETSFTSDEGALYQAVLPKVRQNTTDGTSNRSSPPPPCPPVPTRSGTGHEGIYHTLEEGSEDPSLQYEDPTLPKFRDSAKPKGMFDSAGHYVPTAEQRKAFGLNYEQQYESTYAAYDKLNFFEEDQIYWAPATTASGLYSQLASKRYREIQRDQIRILEQLGSGQFGKVCKALWTVGGDTLELAVKTLKPGASEADKVKFLQEAAIMGQFSHTNVIKMYGVVTLGEPDLICLEILANGDLRSYLQGLQLSGSKHRDFMEAQVMFLKFAKDIAAGMDYLSQKSFVHRDLAARNILLDKSLTCKVADFGMARDLMDDTYYTSSGGTIPVKWTAPEALLYKKYSANSDVWSYGMVLFEIWSVAKKPFSTVSNNQVLRLVQKGFCQAPPPGCPRAIYELMVDCWNPDHPSRPSFSTICSSYLQQSSARILYWAPEDKTLSPAVEVCGAPLNEACKLHLDLQEKYKKYLSQ